MISNVIFYSVFGGFTVLSGIYIYIIVKKNKTIKLLDKNKLTLEV